MGFFDRIAQGIVRRGLFGITFGGGTDPSNWQFAQDWIRGAMPDPEALAQPFAQVSAYNRCVSVITRDATSVPLEFFTVDSTGEPSDEPVSPHPLEAVFKRPNPYMQGRQLFVGSWVSKRVFGEYFWYFPELRVGSRGRPRALEQSNGRIDLLDPRSVKVKVEDGEITYQIQTERGLEDLDTDFLVHSKTWNPYNVFRGLPGPAAIMADLGATFQAARWNERFFGEQNGIPSGLLVPSMESGVSMLGRDQRQELLRTWNQRHGRKRTVGILPAGWRWEDLGINQKEMDFKELREFSRDEILGHEGVPPLIAGYLTKPVTYNASEQKEMYWESTITNFVNEEVSVLNDEFLPKVGVAEKIFPKWEVVQAMLENLGEKTEVAKTWFDMGLSKKVINERLEMGWDETDIPDYDVGYLPFSISTVEQVNEPPEPMPAALPPMADDEEAEQRYYRSRLNGDRRAMVWKAIVDRTRDLEARFDKVVRSHFKGIERDILAQLAGPENEVRQFIQKAEVVIQIDWDEKKRELQRRTSPIHRESLRRGGQSIILEAALAITFNLDDPAVIAKLVEMTGKITRIDDTLERELRRALAEGVAASETLFQLRDRVATQMEASLGRSLTIARTETGFAYNTGRHQSMKQAGIQQHEWLTSRDPDVRDTHVVLDGQRVAIGEQFSNGLAYPQDPSGAPSEIINCRCVAIPVSA